METEAGNSHELLGITWAHDRAVLPLVRTATAWQAEAQVGVTWRTRTLKEFGEVPLSELIERFDLLVIDHPFVGRAAEAGLILPLEEMLDADYLTEQTVGSVGGSHRSYRWGSRQYALAIDAAAQVMAVRPDLLRGAPPPTWPEILSGLPGLGMPMNATDVVPTFLTLCNALGQRPFHAHRVTTTRSGVEVLTAMRRLAEVALDWTLDANPIDVFEAMATSDEISVVPAAFGYTNYARAGYRPHRLRFVDLPAVSPGATPAGSTLGGAGLAVSSRTRHPVQAAAYAAFVADPATQRGLYVRAGGQPAHRAAWDSAEADALTGGFFSGTRATMDHAVVRPRHAGYLDWQDGVGPVLAEFVRGTGDPQRVLAELERRYAACLRSAERSGEPVPQVDG